MYPAFWTDIVEVPCCRFSVMSFGVFPTSASLMKMRAPSGSVVILSAGLNLSSAASTSPVGARIASRNSEFVRNSSWVSTMLSCRLSSESVVSAASAS